MNKAITDGIEFMPPAFESGLDVWSSGDGTPGSDTYDNASNAAFVPADQDFGGALEILKTDSVTKLRYMGETPLLPGCYLRIKARVKAVSGSLPDVRVAGWAGGAGGAHVNGLPETAPTLSLSSYGDVVEVSAIVGTGERGGVDMVWGPEPLYGHFGIDLTGANGGVIRIDDIEIEDISSAFLRDLVGMVDVRDYGAIGDGSTDNHVAFEAADAAAAGRTVLIPEGTYYLGDGVTFQSHVRFVGNVTMPTDKILSLTKDYHLPAYLDAFGNAELGFRKAFQALFNNSKHESLDLGGLLIEVDAPIDMQAAVPNRTVYKTRRVIRNGQFSANSNGSWNTKVETSQATYNPNNAYTLSNVINAANVPVGARVEGNGVGREIYVSDVNIGAQTITLSQPLYDAAGTQTYTFRRHKFLLDFSGFENMSKFSMADIEFQCGEDCSGILLPRAGKGFHLRDCFISRPKHKGITSHGTGCQGLMLDRCQFLSMESPLLAPNRKTIAVNTNANDVKLRHNRAVHFRHFAVLAGSSSIIVGNHIFQGDTADPGPRLAGIVLNRTNNRGTIANNYICDCSIDWMNEYDQDPDYSNEFSFSSLSITGNVFLSQSTSPGFNFIKVKPYGNGHYINGLTVTDNTFRLIDGNINRVEGVDTSFADLDYDRFKIVTFANNAFRNVNEPVENPLMMHHEENSTASTWVVSPNPRLPFKAYAQVLESVMAKGAIRDNNNDEYWGVPYYSAKEGPNKNRIHLKWEKAVKGTVTVRVRIDDPI